MKYFFMIIVSFALFQTGMMQTTNTIVGNTDTSLTAMTYPVSSTLLTGSATITSSFNSLFSTITQTSTIDTSPHLSVTSQTGLIILSSSVSSTFSTPSTTTTSTEVSSMPSTSSITLTSSVSSTPSTTTTVTEVSSIGSIISESSVSFTSSTPSTTTTGTEVSSMPSSIGSKISPSSVSSTSSTSPNTTTAAFISSSTQSTTPTTITSITSPFWVQTVCNIDPSIDVTSQSYQTSMERLLSNSYAIANSATQTTGRRRRAAINGTNSLVLVSITRVTAGQSPSILVYYITTTSGAYVIASTVISNMNQLSLQQMSIILGVPVTTVATYYNAILQNPSVDQQLWIIGAVFGSLAGVALIIWLVLFLYSRCIVPWDEPLIEEKSDDLESAKSSNEYLRSEAHDTFIANPLVGSHRNKAFINDEQSKEKYGTEYNERQLRKEKSKKEIVIKHVYEDEQPKTIKKLHRKRSSSPSTDDSLKTNKKDKQLTPKVKEVNSENVEIHSENATKKKHKKKVKKEVVNPEVVETQIVQSLHSAVLESPNGPQTMSVNDDDNDENEKMERMIDLFDQSNKKKSSLTDVDYKPIQMEVQPESREPTDININRVEVKPNVSVSNSINEFDLIKPVPFVDNYNSIHIFPRYPNENILISDTTLNILELQETEKLDKLRNEMTKGKSIKSNLRTLEPMPRKTTSFDKPTNTEDLAKSLRYDITDLK